MNDPQERPAATPVNQLRQSVHAEIGQLLLIYQHIELLLKALLPHIQASEQAGLDSKDIDNLLDSKHTMGLLVERLKNSAGISNSEAFSGYVAQITMNRNELVHKFTMKSFGGLDSEQKCNDAIEYLKAHHQFALPLRDLLLQLLSTQLKQEN
jgi:hypothetical protein